MLPEDSLYRNLYQPGEQREDQNRGAADFIWSKYTYGLDQIVEDLCNYILC